MQLSGFYRKTLRYEDSDEDKRNCNILTFSLLRKGLLTVEFGNGGNSYILCRKTNRNYVDYGPDKTLVTIKGNNIPVLQGGQVDEFLNDILINAQYKRCYFKDVFSRYNILTQDNENFIQGMKDRIGILV